MAAAAEIQRALQTARDAYDYEVQAANANKQLTHEQLHRLGDLVNTLQGLLHTATTNELASSSWHDSLMTVDLPFNAIQIDRAVDSLKITLVMDGEPMAEVERSLVDGDNIVINGLTGLMMHKIGRESELGSTQCPQAT